MEAYTIGKDMQSILNRLERIEKIIQGGAGRCVCKNSGTQGGPTSSGIGTELVSQAAARASGSSSELSLVPASGTETRRSKHGKIGRIDHAECECQEQSITIWEDGTFSYVSSQYNHSNPVFDNGDRHRMTVYIYAVDELVYSFACDTLVRCEQTKLLRHSGQSDRLRDRFDLLSEFRGRVDCQ